ncbi:MAG: leucine--tRNA ligase [Chitinophagaceae bacterium]|nr:leucine--tRNA ligase [Chitinophagaceae bacterium]
MEYQFRQIESKWQEEWKKSGAYKVSDDLSKPKCFVLDMFPYPSGAGLHVGHPLGYIASDIYSRYKRLKGFNVLHPMGFDSFGLPAEQYALDTGQHPAVTTKKNIETFKSQLNNIGFCYDWEREVQTSDPAYYKWTQWIFLQLFGSFFNRQTGKAEPVENLVAAFEQEGNAGHPCPGDNRILFTAAEWETFDEKQKADILMEYRLAYCGYGEVNWCEALGTVLANDEVVNGVSERGGHPVVKKKLRQWYLRITEYADRLLEGLDRIEFSDAMKEMQTNWIGKSSGAEIDFEVKKPVRNTGADEVERATTLRVYTTRPDTIFGVDFMVVAPELDIVEELKSDEQAAAVDEYLAYVKSRSERERMAEKKISGVFTGSYAINPFDGREIPIWISEYVLAGYGTGAIMAVPCGDERDHKFARHFNIPITNIIGSHYNGEEANPTKDAILENSGFLNGLLMKEAIEVAIGAIEEKRIGVRKKNYKMRDAAFSRQRYWGEPFPIVWKNGIAYPFAENELPLELPHVDSYKPGPDGEGPLANIKDWTGRQLETNTMPGYAGSSWYFLRYMDPKNDQEFCSRKLSDYWNQVDLYIGGTEHAVGHLLYSRMWTKVLFDLGHIGYDEPYKKLVNQGMIQGVSAFANFIGFNFGVNMLGDITEDQKQLVKELKEKYVALKNVFLSDDLMDVIRKSYLEPKTDEEKEHMTLQNKLYSLLLKPVYEDIEVMGLKDIVRVAPLNNYYRVHIPIEYVNHKDELDEERLKSEVSRFEGSIFIAKNEKFICSREVEKMSKSKYNVENPDVIIEKYGADTFRMYEMFLGPVELSKPWDTKGIEGVHRFLKKFWRLFADETKGWLVTDAEPTAEELKVLHRTIKKIEDDTERFSFNTAVSGFMIATNELSDLKCHKRAILEPLLILLTPYAPHICAELWQQLGHSDSILDAPYPVFDARHVAESSKEYPVSVNGKLRTTMTISLDAAQAEVEALVLANEVVQKWLEGKTPKKIIFVRGKMVNVVV